LPVLRLWNFGGTPRYSLQTLPVFALLAARAGDPFAEGRSVNWRLIPLPVLLAAVWMMSDGPPASQMIPVLLAYVGAAALASVGWKRGAAAAVVIAACLGLGIGGAQMTTPGYVAPTVTWLDEHAAEIRGATVYTNSALLASRIAASPALADTAVRFIVGPDVLFEMNGLSNADNGQRDALLRLTRTELFGPSVFWDELTPDALPRRSLFVLRPDARLALTLPERVWAGHLHRIGTADAVTIDDFVATATEPPHASAPRS